MGEIVDLLACPGCDGKDFLEGPHGGMAVKVKCAKCGYVLNVVPLPGGKIWIVDKFGVHPSGKDLT